MTTAITQSCQGARPTEDTATFKYHRTHTQPLHLAGRLLHQFEQDLKAADNRRAHLVNTALMEMRDQLTPAQAQQLDRQIEAAWKRACGFPL